jgi:hypothetical protein
MTINRRQFTVALGAFAATSQAAGIMNSRESRTIQLPFGLHY